MKMKDLVKKYEDLHLGNEEDDRKLLDFYNSVNMSAGKFNIKFEREPSFIKLLEYEGKKHFILQLHINHFSW